MIKSLALLKYPAIFPIFTKCAHSNLWKNFKLKTGIYMFSKKYNYGIRAIVYIASLTQGTCVSTLQISRTLNIPFHFLTKILQTLCEHGILISHRGSKGGIELARSADSITLLDIIEVFDGQKVFQECLLSFVGCNGQIPCSVHGEINQHLEQLREFLSKTTIRELVLQNASLPIAV